MRRREVIASLGATVAVPGSVLGQRRAKPFRIALVHSAIPAAELTESAGPFWVRRLLQRLRGLGYVEGDTVLVQRFSAEGRQERFAGLARDIVAGEPDVIVMNYSVLARAFQAATTTIPLVGIVADPVRTGLIPSLAHPGGNFTGVSVDAGAGLFGKRLHLLRELLPAIRRVAYLGTPVEWDGPNAQELRAAGDQLGLAVFGALSEQFGPQELRGLFGDAVREGADAVVMSQGGFVLAHRKLIVGLAADSRLPAMYAFREFVEAGGLAAYGTDLGDAAEHLASQVDQVLKGAKAGDVPVREATRFALVVNGRTARDLGIAFPATFLARADEVIE